MGVSPRRPSEESAEQRRESVTAPRRTAAVTPTARLAVLYALLLCTGYLAGVLHHRCSGDGTSAFSKWAAIAFHIPSASAPVAKDKATFVSHHVEEAPAAAKVVPEVVHVAPPTNQTLRFPVCNGFTNQRLAILYGMILAKGLGRAAVLPVLIDNGLQRTDASVLASADNQVPFDQVYDLPYFRERMERAGVRVILPSDAPPLVSYTSVNLGGIRGKKVDSLSIMYSHVRHLAVDCPLFKLQSYELRKEDSDFVWAVLTALRPSPEATNLVNQIGAAIMNVAAAKSEEGKGNSTRALASVGSAGQAAGSGAASSPPSPHIFNYIHLRIENDWVEHCKRWESIRDGIVRDNCYRNTEDVDVQLALYGIKPEVPLYVATYWDDVETSRRDQILTRLTKAGFTIVTSADVFPEDVMKGRGREFKAMIEYFVGMQSQRFIGNSVSTFAALGLMERRHLGKWAAYYNGGNIPLASVMPLLHRLPWVFTYNSWSPAYDYLLKGAVRSAAASGSFQPYCLFMGSMSSTIYAWMVNNNVTIISYEPKWRAQLLAIAGRARDNVHHSHLFKTPDMLVSTFQRVDLPVVPELDQYTYVLYTDADVYFRRPISLDDFGLPLPRSVSMSYEMDNMFPYNAGVMLCNLPTMRTQYNDFIRMMLDNDDGLYYPNYGPADQGILNKFYERDLRARMLSQQFNTKPYNPFDQNSFIVHFHGPKPHELAQFLKTGNCDFKGLCERAFLSGLCKYMPEWANYVSDELVAVRLVDACTLLDNPVMKRLRIAAGGRRRLLSLF